MQAFAHWRRHLKEIPADHWKFSGVEFFFWFMWAACGYLTVFLQGKGLSASQVGMIGAMNSAVGIVAAPVWGMVSDKMRSVRRVLLLCVVAGSLIWALVPPLYGAIPMGSISVGLLLVPLSCFFRNPSSSLMESWVVQNTNKQRLNYGSIRLWGSIGYAIMNVSLSLLMPIIGVNTTFYIFAASSLPLVLLCLYIKDDAVKLKALPLKEMHVGRLFKSYPFVTYLIFAVALNMPVNTIFTFLPYLMTELHVDTNLYGILSACRAMLEIPSLVFMVRIRKRFSLPTVLLMAAGLYTLESYGYTFISGVGPLVLSQMVHGLASGMFIGCSANYIFSLAPEGLKATAQTVNGSVNSLAGILGSLLGGYLLDLMGVRQFYLVSGTMILLAGCFFLGTIWWSKKRQEKGLST